MSVSNLTDIRKILIDVDPEVRGEPIPELPAIERGQRLAIAAGASIDLVLSDTAGGIVDGDFADRQGVLQAREVYLEEMADWLELVAAKLHEKGIRVNCHVESGSHRYEIILEKARELDADLIVRAAKKHSRIDRLFFTPTDWELIRRSPQPIWLVKKAVEPAARGLQVLAAVDPLHPEEKKAGLDKRIVALAGKITQLFGGTTHLFHAYQPGAIVAPMAAASHQGAVPVLRLSSELSSELEKHRRTELRKLSDPAGIAEDHVHLLSGSTTDVLNELVMQLGIDVVVAGAVSRGRIERLLIGNTAEAILDDVCCDVVVVKPDNFQNSSGNPSQSSSQTSGGEQPV